MLTREAPLTRYLKLIVGLVGSLFVLGVGCTQTTLSGT